MRSPTLDTDLVAAALEYHRHPAPGKVSVVPTKALINQRDLALAYSPGVAAACKAIVADPAEAAALTSRANLVGVVTNGTAVLVIAALEYGMGEDAVSRVIQGLVTGIGFVGAGVIMKIQGEREIRGLTTAAGVWMTAASSIAIGLGQIGVGVMAALLAWVVLAALKRLEARMKASADEHA